MLLGVSCRRWGWLWGAWGDRPALELPVGATAMLCPVPAPPQLLLTVPAPALLG